MAVDIQGHNEMTDPSEWSSGTMVHDGLDRNAIGEATSEILNLRNYKGRTALSHAVDYRREEILKILLDLGADPTISDFDGNTALHLAIQHNLSDKIISYIIKAARPKALDILGHNEMTDPSGCSSVSMVHDGLNRNTIGEATSEILNLSNNFGRTALSHAVYYRREEISRILLDVGADPTIADIDGNTALHLAIQHNLDKIIIYIIQAARTKAVDILGHKEVTDPSGCSSCSMVHDGLDRNAIGETTSEIMNLKNNKGQTAFCTAIDLDRGDIANILFLNGADPTISDNYGDSPLHSRFPTYMTDEMIILMIENIAVNYVNRDGNTLLRSAIICKREVLVKHLLMRGADPIIPDRDGNSALHLAIERGLSEQIIIDIIKAATPKPIHLMFQNPMTKRFYTCFIRQLLTGLNQHVISNIFALSCDAIFSLRNRFGQTAFFLAVRLDRFDMAQILLENGADPTITDNDRNTPLHTLLNNLPDDSILSMIQNIDVNHQYNDGSTLFQCAIKCRREVLVINLLKRGINPIIADANGNTALHLAIKHNLSRETIISIIEAATPRTANILGQNGMTDPLVCSNLELVHDRLDRDVNRLATSDVINLRNQKWETALFLAVTLARFDIVQILVERGADLNIADIAGNTPFHTHMPTELTDEIIISMIENIDVDQAGNDGATLLHRAIECRTK